MSKKKPADFEKSIASLEELVNKMEEESIPLNQLLEYYEKGNTLIQQCEDSLADARKQLQTIKDQASTPKQSKASVKEQDNDDIQLF